MPMPKVDKFILCVKAHKCLYDSNHLNFRDFTARKMAWERISAELKTEVPILQKQWLSLREAYFKEKRRLQRHRGAVVAEDFTWPYYSQMDFMAPFLKSDRASTNQPHPLDEQLIDLMRTRRYMYDKSSKEYRVKEVKQSAWKEIADVLNEPVLAIRVRWKTLRDRYVKETRILEDLSPTEDQEQQKSSWLLYPKLDFLKDCIEPRKIYHRKPASAKRVKRRPGRPRGRPRKNRPPQQSVQVKEEMEVDSVTVKKERIEEPENTERWESDEWEDSSFISMSASPMPDLESKVVVEEAIIAPSNSKVAQLPDQPDLPDSQNSQNQTPQPPQADLTTKYVSIIDDKLRLLPEREREQVAMAIINMLNNRIFER